MPWAINRREFFRLLFSLVEFPRDVGPEHVHKAVNRIRKQLSNRDLLESSEKRGDGYRLSVPLENIRFFKGVSDSGLIS